MSRSGYNEDIDDQWSLIKWRGQVASAMRGRRGQKFLREMLAALDALPEKRLIKGDLQQQSGEVCALGAVGIKRGIDLQPLDPYDHDTLSGIFGIAHQLVQEIEYENDEGWRETPEQRWQRMRNWVASCIIDE